MYNVAYIVCLFLFRSLDHSLINSRSRYECLAHHRVSASFAAFAMFGATVRKRREHLDDAAGCRAPFIGILYILSIDRMSATLAALLAPISARFRDDGPWRERL